jgi:hypothetical protein
MSLSLMNMLGLVKCTYRTYSVLLNILAFPLIYKQGLYQSSFAKQIMCAVLIEFILINIYIYIKMTRRVTATKPTG